MPSRKQRSASRHDAEAGNGSPQRYAELSAHMRSVHIARIVDMPKIELYRDQVLTLVSEELAPFYPPGEKILTGSMVNNYVKQHIVPAPVRKRYTRRHVAWLLCVCLLKRVVTIAQIARIIEMLAVEDIDVARAYDTIAESFERALASVFPSDEPGEPAHVDISVALYDHDGRQHDGVVNRLLEDGIVMVAHRVHADHLLALEDA